MQVAAGDAQQFDHDSLDLSEIAAQPIKDKKMFETEDCTCTTLINPSYAHGKKHDLQWIHKNQGTYDMSKTIFGKQILAAKKGKIKVDFSGDSGQDIKENIDFIMTVNKDANYEYKGEKGGFGII